MLMSSGERVVPPLALNHANTCWMTWGIGRSWLNGVPLALMVGPPYSKK
jgi:hypothetical protein